MDFGLAAASLIIAFFAIFIVWGRSRAGQDLLVRVFGPARAPKAVRTSRRRTPTSKSTSRSKTTAAKSTSSRQRRTTKR